MIIKEIIQSENSEELLCLTKSSEQYKLLQIETNIIYGSEVIDSIIDYDKLGNPITKFTYQETNIKDNLEEINND